MENNSEHIRKLINQSFTTLDLSKKPNENLMDVISEYQLNSKPKITFTKTLTIITPIIMIAIIATLILMSSSTPSRSQSFEAPASARSKINPYLFQSLNTVIEKPLKQNAGNEKNSSFAKNETILSFTKTPTQVNQVVSGVDNSKKETTSINNIPEQNKTKVEDSNYVFPTLTEDEIKANNKQKKKMIELLAKQSKTKYCYVPMGSYTRGDKTVSLQSFYIQNTEVTNIEYKTFLFDLLINNKKDEFLKAKPNQNLWITAITKTEYRARLAKEYFSEKVFNDFPVVNITQEGAEMYCKWLTTETNNNLSNKGKKALNDIRIPSVTEWEYAAKGGLNSDYPWGYNKIQNKNNCFMANFSVEKNKTDLNFNCEAIKHKEALTTAALMLDGEQTSVYVFAYNPNNYGVYCTSGNVSEMVYQQDKNFNILKTVISKGGSWNTDYESCKINNHAAANTKLGEPTLGFRPVFSFIKK